MARSKGNLLNCLEAIHGHLEPYHARTMVDAGANTAAGIMRRNAIIDAEVVAAMERVKTIRRTLVRRGHSDLAALFDEPFEFGID